MRQAVSAPDAEGHKSSSHAERGNQGIRIGSAASGQWSSVLGRWRSPVGVLPRDRRSAVLYGYGITVGWTQVTLNGVWLVVKLLGWLKLRAIQ